MNQMFYNVPKLEEDEYITSYICRTLYENGITTFDFLIDNKFINKEKNERLLNVFISKYLNDFINKINFKGNLLDFLLKTTTVGLNVSLMDENDVIIAIDELYNENINIKDRFYELISYSSNVKVCPECLKHQKSTKGFVYINRIHQLPYMKCCHIHGDVNLRKYKITDLSFFIHFEESATEINTQSLDYYDYRIASLTEQLVHDPLCISKKDLINFLLKNYHFNSVRNIMPVNDFYRDIPYIKIENLMNKSNIQYTDFDSYNIMIFISSFFSNRKEIKLEELDYDSDNGQVIEINQKMIITRKCNNCEEEYITTKFDEDIKCPKCRMSNKLYTKLLEANNNLIKYSSLNQILKDNSLNDKILTYIKKNKNYVYQNSDIITKPDNILNIVDFYSYLSNREIINPFIYINDLKVKILDYFFMDLNKDNLTSNDLITFFKDFIDDYVLDEYTISPDTLLLENFNITHNLCNKTFCATKYEILLGKRCPYCTKKLNLEDLSNIIKKATNNEYELLISKSNDKMLYIRHYYDFNSLSRYITYLMPKDVFIQELFALKPRILSFKNCYMIRIKFHSKFYSKKVA